MVQEFTAAVFHEGRMVVPRTAMRALVHRRDDGQVSHWHGSFEVVPMKWAVADGRDLTLCTSEGEDCRVTITHVRPMEGDEIQVCFNGVGEPPPSLQR